MNNELQQLKDSLRKLEIIVDEFVANTITMNAQIEKTTEAIKKYTSLEE